MTPTIDWTVRTTWTAGGAFVAAAIPLVVFLSGDEFVLTLIVAVVGAAAGFTARPLATGARR